MNRPTDCDTRMDLLLQIDSEVHLPWGFGDAGIGHLTGCTSCQQQLAFGWACS